MQWIGAALYLALFCGFGYLAILVEREERRANEWHKANGFPFDPDL